jgi:hypothetical protein
VLLASIFSSLVAGGEAHSVANTALGAEIFDDEDMLLRFRQDDPGWGLPESWFQHLHALATLAVEFESNEPISNRIGRFDEVVTNALDLLGQLEAAGAALSPAHTSRLNALQRGVEKFATDERI